MFPKSINAAFTQQMQAEHILERLALETLKEWAPYAHQSYELGVTAAAGDPRSWWQVFWHWIYETGAALLYSDTMRRAAHELGVTWPEPPRNAIPDAPPAPIPPYEIDTGILADRARRIVETTLRRSVPPPQQTPFTIRQAQQRYLTQARNRYANVPTQVFANVTRDIDRELARGENPEQGMAQRVERTLSHHLAQPELAKTARRIARTESAAAQSAATLDVARNTAAVADEAPDEEWVKYWVSTLDHITRPTHRAAHTQKAPLNGKFQVGGFQIDHPGDGPPQEAFNCRCSTFVLRTDEPLPEGFTPFPETVAAAAALNGEPTMGTYRTFTATLTELGTQTDDGRMLAADMELSFRTFPIALRWQETDDPGHDHAYTVGVITEASLQGQQVVATGYLLNTPQADQAADQITHGVTRPSVDIGAATVILTDEDGNPIDVNTDDDITPIDLLTGKGMIETLTEGKIMGATLVSIAAFDRPTDIELTGTIDIEDAGVDALVAALSPTTAARDDHRQPFADFCPRPELFEDPELTRLTDVTYDETTGRVFGHIAPWGVAHIGLPGRKVTAPRSQCGYAKFHECPAPFTLTNGERIKTGKLTVNCGHAGLRLASDAAAAHYDHTGTCWAYVRAGEDQHGIWFSGVLNPDAEDATVRAGLMSPLSGDWRPDTTGHLELRAALSVNVPGFPLVASATDDAGEMLALVAALGPRANRTTFANTSSLPIAPLDTPWDAGKAQTAILDHCGDDKTCWSPGYLIVGNTVSASKFPIADVINNQLQIVPKGVQAAAQRASSATDLDRAALESKICSLYSKIRGKFPDFGDCPFDKPARSESSVAADPFTEGEQSMATPPPPPADTDTKPAQDDPKVKFPEGTTVTIKDGGDEGEVTDALTGQTVYRVGDAWYLENELEAAGKPAQEEEPPAKVAAAIARELHTPQKRDKATSDAFAKVKAVRTARAKRLLNK